MTMHPPRFDYLAPTSVTEAVRALREHPRSRVLAGGQSLIPDLRARRVRPSFLVDLRRLDLDGIDVRDGSLRLGAMVTHAAVEGSERIGRLCPLLARTARQVADPLVRNLGTVAGSLAEADPASDWGAALLAARARVDVAGPGGQRVVPVADLFVGQHETVLARDELIAGIEIPADPDATGTYLKIRRKVGDFATVGAAVQLRLDRDGRVEDCGIGLAGVGLRCVRAEKAEEYLRGRRLDARVAQRAAGIAAEGIHPHSDHRCSAAYRRRLVEVLTARGLRTCRARGGSGPGPV